MKQVVVPLCLFGLFAALFFGMGGVGHAHPLTPNLEIARDTEGNLYEELDLGGSFTINPCKYAFWHSGKEVIKTTVNNRGNTACFDMGDGNIISIGAGESIEYSYNVKLKKEEVKLYITRLASGAGVVLQEALALRIVPKS